LTSTILIKILHKDAPSHFSHILQANILHQPNTSEETPLSELKSLETLTSSIKCSSLRHLFLLLEVYAHLQTRHVWGRPPLGGPLSCTSCKPKLADHRKLNSLLPSTVQIHASVPKPCSRTAHLLPSTSPKYYSSQPDAFSCPRLSSTALPPLPTRRCPKVSQHATQEIPGGSSQVSIYRHHSPGAVAERPSRDPEAA